MISRSNGAAGVAWVNGLPALVEQLKPGGRMVIPVGERWGAQDLLLIGKRADGSVERKSVLPVRFVPLVHGA